MRRTLVVLFQAVIVLIGIMTLGFLIWFPLTEGRATNLGLFDIYSDKFILYGYITSIFFFVALYNSFKLLGYIRQHKVFSTNSVKTLKNIKYCTVVLVILIVAAGLIIEFTHNKEDDPAGFLAICIVTTFVSTVIAIAAAVFQKILRNAVDMKSKKMT